MKWYQNIHFWIGLFVGGLLWSDIYIILHILALIKLYQSGNLILP